MALCDQSFPRSGRLRRRAEYLAVQRSGRKVVTEHFLVFNRAGSTRIGITVSSKVGKAVVRNRLRRWIREYMRTHRGEIPAGESVIVARPSAAHLMHEAFDRDLSLLLARARDGR
ncbi:MAG: ribonuclease P protein component [Deltaproteobacteria bacterium]|nr:ribonuclease P protein component [Deltaproteobacteria bacterium]